jgi:putative N6-adenine-specific DNA methylase
VPDLTPRGLERRIKRHLLKADVSLFANTAPGFETELAAEVALLPGVVGYETTLGGMAFSGALDLVYQANLRLRTAHRVLLRLDDFLAQSHPMLFDRARKIPWERYLGFHEDVAVTVSAKASRLNHRAQIAQTVLRAVQRSQADLGVKVQHDERSDRRIVVRLFRDRCTVSFDTSGRHLHRRSYRRFRGKGPIRETLAAAILMRVGAERYATLVDPFCGSGTLLIEAATRDAGLPPGVGRRFGFEGLAFYDQGRWERTVANALKGSGAANQNFFGSDRDDEAIDGARQNALAAGVASAIAFEAGAAEDLALPASGGDGLIVANLPYGVRVDRGRKLLPHFLDRIVRRGGGWDVALIVRDPSEVERPGLTVTRTTPFRNGGLAVHLVEATIATP